MPNDGASSAAAALMFTVYLGVNLGALLLASRTARQPRRYLNSTAVALSEFLKFITSFLLMYGSAPSLRAAAATAGRTLFGMPEQMARVAVPALLYTIQNNIIYVALTHLDAVSFQIIYQLKIVAAMMASRLLLKKKASATRWLSVLLLTAGVILVRGRARGREGGGLCMYACMHMHMSATQQVHVLHTYVPCTYMYIYTHTCVYVCMHAWMHE